MSQSCDCAFNLHELCDPCDCECHNEKNILVRLLVSKIKDQVDQASDAYGGIVDPEDWLALERLI